MTPLLLIDVGNSRIKWAPVSRGRRSSQRHAPLRNDGRATFRELLAGAPKDLQVLAVNVAGRAVERALRAAARAARLPRPRFLRSSEAAAGVINGYDEAWRLGADRWAALIGARHLQATPRPACIVSVGTAMTVDFLDAAGRHRGGYIVPGPTLAVVSLLAGTAGILRRSRGGRPARRDSWPRSTIAAIEGGAREACVAMILRSQAEARRRLGRSTRLILTGGAIPSLREALPAAALSVPDLVLRGLHVALGGD